MDTFELAAAVRMNDTKHLDINVITEMVSDDTVEINGGDGRRFTLCFDTQDSRFIYGGYYVNGEPIETSYTYSADDDEDDIASDILGDVYVEMDI